MTKETKPPASKKSMKLPNPTLRGQGQQQQNKKPTKYNHELKELPQTEEKKEKKKPGPMTTVHEQAGGEKMDEKAYEMEQK